MPCDYVLPSHGSSSKQLGHADMLEWVKNANYIVKRSGRHNYLETRLTVPSGLNIFNWRRYLEHYNLKILCEYLEFGFPLCVDEKILKYNLEVTNHASALCNPTGVDKYFTEEVLYNAMLGPLATPPFTKMHFSPIMARAKSDGDTRVIVDLSWPHANSVNSCVPTNNFDFMTFQLKYPTIDHVVEKIRQYRSDALLYKVDLQRAFCNLRIDPANYNLLGLSWRQQTYIDVAMPFGFRQGAASCQMCTDAIVYLMWSQKFWVMAYLDDIMGVVKPYQANDTFLTLTHLLKHLGLPSNNKKIEPPNHNIICLGIEIDEKQGTLSIPAEKLEKCVTIGVTKTRLLGIRYKGWWVT